MKTTFALSLFVLFAIKQFGQSSEVYYAIGNDTIFSTEISYQKIAKDSSKQITFILENDIKFDTLKVIEARGPRLIKAMNITPAAKSITFYCGYYRNGDRLILEFIGFRNEENEEQKETRIFVFNVVE
jgi:hypothetical protein